MTAIISRRVVFDSLFFRPEEKSERFQMKVLRRPCHESRTSLVAHAEGDFQKLDGFRLDIHIQVGKRLTNLVSLRNGKMP